MILIESKSRQVHADACLNYGYCCPKIHGLNADFHSGSWGVYDLSRTGRATSAAQARICGMEQKIRSQPAILEAIGEEGGCQDFRFGGLLFSLDV